MDLTSPVDKRIVAKSRNAKFGSDNDAAAAATMAVVVLSSSDDGEQFSDDLSSDALQLDENEAEESDAKFAQALLLDMQKNEEYSRRLQVKEDAMLAAECS